MSEPAKFLFNERFGEPVEKIDETEAMKHDLRTQFEDELLQARELALLEGRKEGQQAALDSLDAKTSMTLDQVIASAATSAQEIDEYCKSFRAEALQFAVMAADKLAAGMLKRDPTAALEKLFDECFELVNEAPHVAIRVNDALADKIKNRVDEAARKKGFDGEILVIPDPEIAPGDGQLEWADGGASRSYQEIRDRIDSSVKRFLEVQDTPIAAATNDIETSEPQSNAAAPAENGTVHATELGELA